MKDEGKLRDLQVIWKGIEWDVRRVLYADYVSLNAEWEESVQVLLHECGRSCDRGSLKINIQENETVLFSKEEMVGGLKIKLNEKEMEK